MDTAYFDFLPNEALEELMLNMDTDTLRAFCDTYSRARETCATDFFWKRKYAKDFPDEVMVKGRTARDAYNQRVAARMILPWTILKAQRAQENCYFIAVPIGARRLISGVHRTWNQTPTWIYRIAGQPADVIMALRAGGVDEQTVNEIMATALTSQNKNIEPFKTMLTDEIDRCNKRKEELKPAMEARAQIRRIYQALTPEERARFQGLKAAEVIKILREEGRLAQ